MSDGGAKDKAKGRVKEAAGALTGNQKLKNKGRVDQATGKVKEKLEKTIDKARKAVNGGDDAR